MNTTLIAIDVMETPQGYKVLFEDNFLTDSTGNEVFKTFKQAIKALQETLAGE